MTVVEDKTLNDLILTGNWSALEERWLSSVNDPTALDELLSTIAALHERGEHSLLITLLETMGDELVKGGNFATLDKMLLTFVR